MLSRTLRLQPFVLGKDSIEIVSELGRVFLANRIERLSHYAWRFRYPGAPLAPEPFEAEAAGHAAGQLLKAVADLLELKFPDSDVSASEAKGE